MNVHALASADTLDAVIAALPAGLPAAEKALLERFARSFFERLPEDELASRPAADWAAAARSFLVFAGQREAGRA